MLNKIISRRKVQVALAVLWIFDGFLQLQGRMFTDSFVRHVIAPAAAGQPLVVSGGINFGIHIFLSHAVFFNSLIAIIQLGIGVLILRKQTVRLGLILSVFWGLFVWYFGEGLGGMLGGHALLLMGAPGAALLYAVLALGVMPQTDREEQSKGRTPSYWLAFVWAVLWVSGGIYQLLPGQNSVSSLSKMIAGNAVRAPGWLANIDIHVAGWINGLGSAVRPMTSGVHMNMTEMAQMPVKAGMGYWFILFLAMLQIFIGLAIFMPAVWRRVGIYIGLILSIGFWVVGQSLGGYFTGLATDPNSAPLFILLGLSVLSNNKLDIQIKYLYKKLSQLLA